MFIFSLLIIGLLLSQAYFRISWLINLSDKQVYHNNFNLMTGIPGLLNIFVNFVFS